MRVTGSSIVLLSQMLLPALAADADAWKSRNIYFALTDRISKGDDNTDACGDLGSYCGGTFKGLESKLDYIAGMGFDAIWITPVITNSEGGYHGYWAQDLYGINENHGTAEELKSLVSAAHDKGIYMMVDVVANHMGMANIQDNAPEPMNKDSSYHDKCEVNYDDQNSVEQCWVADLPDVNTENQEVIDFYQTWIKYLVSEYDFDGVRIDTVKHVSKDFWPGFSSAAGVYTIGEVFDGDVDFVAGYSGTMDGLLNYPIYYPMNRFYQQQGSAQEMADMHDIIGSKFPDPTTLGTFLDNHDNARWLSQKDDTTLLANCLAYVILSRGIPIVYYGTEQGYAGGNDPANREDLWRSGYNTDADLYKTISKLSAARKAAGGLAGDDQKHLYIADNAYAWSRADGDLIVLTTNGGSGSSGNHCFDSQKPNGSWNNTMADGTIESDGNGQLCIDIQDGQPVVLVAS
ncbi:glycoside hydrolase family 13 protein [Astrocystis sublimbata]|nr:glycoside hydrolase family 13 protein [Astrocystis sublimbata]